MSKTGTDLPLSALTIFRQYKQLGERSLAQLTTEECYWKPSKASNSIYTIIKHMHGNMRSRWTDFLTTDGEKEWRNRDEEFEEEHVSKEELLRLWNEGWQCVFDALEPLSSDDIGRIVKIRGEEHSVLEAINRQVAHYSYHVGQIVYIAKALKDESWETLSIAPGKSKEFNEQMNKKH